MIFIYFFLRGKTFWASFIHGLMAAGFSILSVFSSDKNKLLLAQMCLINSIVYFIADLFVRFDYKKTFHHLLCIFGCTLVLHLSPEDIIFTAKICGLIEITNPCWTFLRLRIEDSDEIYLPSWYTKLIAAIVYILVFFFIRIVWFSKVLFYEIPDDIPANIYHITFTPFYLLNIYFFMELIYKFIQAVKKHYFIPPVILKKIKLTPRCD